MQLTMGLNTCVPFADEADAASGMLHLSVRVRCSPTLRSILRTHSLGISVESMNRPNPYSPPRESPEAAADRHEGSKLAGYNGCHPLLRLTILTACTTPPLLLMMTVFMPPGFAGVPYMGLVLVVFVALFVAVAFVERSLFINFVVILLFWSSMCLIQVMHPGAAPSQTQHILNGLLQISTIAVAHSVIQLGIGCAVSNWLKAE